MKFTAALFALYAFFCGQCFAAERAARPNVLFLVSDDLRPELGCYGNTIIKSPNMDRLAQRGMVFNRAYCQQAVCSPSRSSVMTGMRPDTTKVWDLNTHFRKALPEVVTLSQLFKNHGYFAQGMGKIYHGDLVDPPSWSATATALMGQDPDVVPTKRTGGARKKAGNNPVTEAENEDPGKLTSTDRGPAFRATDDPANGGGEGKLADEAIAALRKFKANAQRFFLAVGFHKPHLPFNSPKVYWDLYDPAKIPMAENRFLPKGAPDYALVKKPELWGYSGVPDVSHLPDDYARRLKHGYYAAVSYMDAQLGRVVDELDKLGLRENTIVILWGDHGWKLGEHDRWAKHSNVENDVRAPLIISVPGMKAVGKKSDALVEFVDMYPTLAELAGLPLPGHLEGTSFKPLLDDPQRPWKSAAFSQYPRTVKGQKLMGYSMRTDRYRFTRWVDRDDSTKVDAVELYDHRTDPQENINIASDPANKALVEKLTAQSVAGWKAAVAPTARPVRAVRSAVSKPFVHPGLLHSRAELDFIKQRIAARTEPWKTAWEQLRDSRAASLDYQPRPRAEVVRGPYNNPNIGSSELSSDSGAAYTHALQWCLTGNEAHARKAIEILNAWSATLKKVSGHDTKLLIGMTGVQLCNAAELLRHTYTGWLKPDQDLFKQLLREILYPPIKDFFPAANGNWDASMIQTMLAMGIFLDDRAMFDRAANYYLKGEGNGAITNYFNAFGECQESGRDQAHTQMGLGFLGCAAEMAWKQGVDLYGAISNRLALGFEYTAKYNLGHDVPYEPYRSIDGKYLYRAISKDSRGRFAPIYERIVYHYHGRKGMEMPFSREAITKVQSGRRDGGAHIPWGALMFAELP